MKKRPAPGDFRVQTEFGGSALSEHAPESLVEQGASIAAKIPAPWLYARVDGVDVGGVFTLMELELIEPELFLARDPRAASRLARATLALCQPAQRSALSQRT